MLSPLLLAHGLAVRGAAAATTVGETFVVPQPGGKGCTAEVMGCYYDKKWDDCRFATEPIKADCTQSAKYRGGRDLPYVLPGCFNDPEKSCKTAPSPPPCDPATITAEKCAADCLGWAKFIPGGGDEIYAGMQAKSVCFCGTSAEGSAALETDSTNELPLSACNEPCPGDPSQLCGSGGRNLIIRVNCGSDWGLSFLLLCGVCGGLYVGGGVAYRAKTQGQPAALASHPHWARWQELRSLVTDGADYARARARGGGGGGRRRAAGGAKGGYGAVDAADVAPSVGKEKKGKGKKRSKEKRSGGEGGGSSRTPLTDAPAPAPVAPAAPSPAAGTAAGDGGRWVHVPS